MNDCRQRTQRTYATIAPQYLENTRDRSLMRAWVDRFAALLPADSLIADVGAGPGFDCSEFRKRGIWAVAVDLSMPMLRSGIAEFPGPRVQADVRALPLGSSSVDGVWANASFVHLSVNDAAGALREIHRVLKESGALHIAVKRGSGSEWESERYGEPRWFQYWSTLELDRALECAEFEITDGWITETPRATWIVRLARRTDV